jgi:hypothetical protein
MKQLSEGGETEKEAADEGAMSKGFCGMGTIAGGSQGLNTKWFAVGKFKSDPWPATSALS